MLDNYTKLCYNISVIKVRWLFCEFHKPKPTFYKKAFCDCDRLVKSVAQGCLTLLQTQYTAQAKVWYLLSVQDTQPQKGVELKLLHSLSVCKKGREPPLVSVDERLLNQRLTFNKWVFKRINYLLVRAKEQPTCGASPLARYLHLIFIVVQCFSLIIFILPQEPLHLARVFVLLFERRATGRYAPIFQRDLLSQKIISTFFA